MDLAASVMPRYGRSLSRALALTVLLTIMTAGCSSPADVVIEAADGVTGFARLTSTNAKGEVKIITLEMAGRIALLGPHGVVGLDVSRIEILSAHCVLLATIDFEGLDISNGGTITLDRANGVRWSPGGRPSAVDGPTLVEDCPEGLSAPSSWATGSVPLRYRSEEPAGPTGGA